MATPLVNQDEIFGKAKDAVVDGLRDFFPIIGKQRKLVLKDIRPRTTSTPRTSPDRRRSSSPVERGASPFTQSSSSSTTRRAAFWILGA